MKLTNLMTQNMQDPIGLGHGVPAFSYLLQSERRGDKQTAYHIIAASSRELLEEKKADLGMSKIMRSPTAAFPCIPGSRFSGKHGYGILRMLRHPGVNRRFMRWGCWRKRTGRLSGSVREMIITVINQRLRPLRKISFSKIKIQSRRPGSISAAWGFLRHL